MADYIAFVNSDHDLQRCVRYYSDVEAIRVSLRRWKPQWSRAINTNIWIDPGLDGYDLILKGKRVFDEWKDYAKQFDSQCLLADTAFLKKPVREAVRTIVFKVLGDCLTKGPDWITVPLLPVAGDSSRNRVSRELSKASGQWKSERRFQGKLILPLIFTRPDQLKGRTQWRKTLALIQKCYSDADASAIWVVDSELSDQKCSKAFATRFEALVRFHEDLRETLPRGAKVIAGPYWGMNLVLWARGLCDHPAVSMGTGYSYMISGTFAPRRAKSHVALLPLRRWAIVSPELKSWLIEALSRLSPDDSARQPLLKLSQAIDACMRTDEAARNQVAGTYKEWLDKIQGIAPEGRMLSLYQDLSSAYVLGKQLPKLPPSEAPGRDAGKVAEQLMLRCL